MNKEVVAGICFNPCMDELYTARKGQGAYLNGKRIHSSRVDKVSFKIFYIFVEILLKGFILLLIG